MTREEKIARLQRALAEPEGTFTHAQIQAKLDSLQGEAPAVNRRGLPELAAKREPSVMDRVKEGVSTMAGGVKAIGSSLMHPIDTATDPSKRRQLVRGVSDAVSAGYLTKAAGAIGRALGDKPEVDLQATEAEDQERAPAYRVGGQMVGSFLPGVTKLAGKGALDVAGKALSKVPGKGALAGAAKGTAQAALGYEMTAPVLAAAHADAGGPGERLEAFKSAATDPLGVGLSLTAGAAGGAGRGKAAAIRDPKTRSGQVLKDFEQAGPGARIKPFGEPVEGGLFESPALKSLPEGKAGKNQLATDSASRVANANQARLKAARQQFGDTVDQILGEHGDARHPMENTHAALDALEEGNLINRRVGDPDVKKAIDTIRGWLTFEEAVPAQLDVEASLAKMDAARRYTRFPRQQRIEFLTNGQAPEFAVMSEPTVTRDPSVAAADHIKARKQVRAFADSAPTPSERGVYRQILYSMDQDAMAVDPRIVQLNRDYANALKPADEASRIVFGKRTKQVGLDRAPDKQLTEAERTTGTQRLGSIGESTQMATTRRVGDRLANVGPEYEREVRLLRAKNAQEQLRRGQPRVSRNLEESTDRRMSKGVIGALIGGPVATGVGVGMDLMSQHPIANQVRLTLPVSERIGRTDGRLGMAVGSSDELSRAVRQRGKKRKKQQDQGADMRQEGG